MIIKYTQEVVDWWILSLSTDNQNVKTNLSRIVALHFNTLLQLVHVLFNYDVEENMLAIILSKLKNFMLYRFRSIMEQDNYTVEKLFAATLVIKQNQKVVKFIEITILKQFKWTPENKPRCFYCQKLLNSNQDYYDNHKLCNMIQQVGNKKRKIN